MGDVIETFTTEKMADELGQNTAEVKRADKVEKERVAAAAASAAAAEAKIGAETANA